MFLHIIMKVLGIKSSWTSNQWYVCKYLFTQAFEDKANWIWCWATCILIGDSKSIYYFKNQHILLGSNFEGFKCHSYTIVYYSWTDIQLLRDPIYRILFVCVAEISCNILKTMHYIITIYYASETHFSKQIINKEMVANRDI